MLGYRLQKRDEPWNWGAPIVIVGALVLSFGISALLLELQGKSAVQGLLVLWQGSFGASWALEDALLKSIPIFLCALGVATAFRMQVWNIGAEGQFALGAIGATWAALTFPDLPGYLLMPFMFICAALFGAVWAYIPAILRLKLQVNEIISTLMLNYIAILLLQYLVFGAWKDPASFGFPVTPEFTPGAIIGQIGDSRLHWGFAVCVGSGVAMWAFMRFTRLGFEIKVAGEGERIAMYSRLPYGMLTILVMAISGALAGWAGCIEASATINRLQPSIMVGYGYTAIVVAWLARLHPLYIGISAYLLAALRVGVENMQLELQTPASFGSIMEGLILLSVLAGQMLVTYKIVKKK
ncbi:ABC transporter permease [Maridesulfovibrio sp.]|uniref:ABC transporter permease n=1 Tax=Maridesulfovibrio sp. TaxID=2795000 RepID=UPI002A18A46C|nr:ABC transporter permease [Maridesulfovibrio sp.]